LKIKKTLFPTSGIMMDTMNNLAVEVLFFVVSAISVLLVVFGIPGNFVPVIIALIATLAGDGRSFNWFWFAVFLFIAVSGEMVDLIVGLIGARKYGSSRAGMIGAVIGGFAGGILGTMAFPLIGSLVGVFVGCFFLTFLFELLYSEKSVDESRHAGFGALIGRVIASCYKLTVGFVLLVLMAWHFWFR